MDAPLLQPGFRPVGFPAPRRGDVAQLVRVPDCRSGGCGFKSRRPRHEPVRVLRSRGFFCSLRYRLSPPVDRRGAHSKNRRQRRNDGGNGSPGLTYVDTDRELRRLVDELREQSIIAVDTEANPMFAYRERLCLIQISTRRRDYLVDPLADIDVAQLGAVLADAGIVKVLHGAEFDVLQLKRAWPIEIRGLFDTRVAAASLGFEAPSLAALLREWLDVEVDKAHQRSDWGKRPLSDGQLEYARDDTRYLIELAELLREDLLDAGFPHMEEVASECRRLEALVPDPGDVDLDDWVRLKGASQLDPIGRRVLRDLSRLRHQLAEERDKPLFKVLPNDALVALARGKPSTPEQMRKSRILAPKLAARYGRDLQRVIARAVERGGLSRMPVGKRAPEDQLRGEQREIYDAIRMWRKRVAERRSTDASLVLTRAMMVELARLRPLPTSVEKLRALRLLEPWRVEEYGEAIVSAIATVR